MLSDQDWKHIEAIIDLAAERACAKWRREMGVAIGEHSRGCEHVKRVKWLLIGIAVGAGGLAGGVGVAIAKIAAAL